MITLIGVDFVSILFVDNLWFERFFDCAIDKSLEYGPLHVRLSLDEVVHGRFKTEELKLISLHIFFDII